MKALPLLKLHIADWNNVNDDNNPLECQYLDPDK